MCYCNCQYDRWSYEYEDCLCMKPKGLPCPQDLTDEEAEHLNNEWEEDAPDEDYFRDGR